MKIITRYLIVYLLLVVTASMAVAGGIRPDSFNLSGIAGGYSFDGKQHLETSPIVGIRGGYNFTKHFGVEALFDFTPTESTLDSLGDAKVYRYGADLLLHLFPDNKLVPFLAAGYGGITVDREHQKTFNKGIFDYGPGIKYFLTDDLALRGDFRHLLFRNNETLSNYEYTVGITYQFGGTKPAQAPVAAIAPPASRPEPKVAPPQEPPLEPIPAAEPTPEKMKYCVYLKIEFDIDKAEIRPQYHDEVAKVGDFMKKHPTTTAVIEGYTDEVGSDDYNMQLSQRRAESVVKSLEDNFGIDRSRLFAKGYGKTKQTPESSSDAGRQKSRHINAIIDCALDVKELAPPPERLCMNLKVEFATDSAEIQAQYFDEMNKVGDYMKKYPTTTAVIEGHTDNVGSPEHNMKLSQMRAETVVNYLVGKFGIERSRLFAKGYGSARRIAYNTTPEGRQKNRRINAVIDCVIQK
ncbi:MULTISPECIES: OmpA family protein [Geobacter]|uniref:OmpA family protein n=1 Tax=Geobacter TaxID=28231 RepID=UPI002573F4B0|nr:OmpA family protein [Geobacter sulfurreducens]BEH09421.1 OmpA family protein [Geobacter sulfurreducens subsp. ethanolicus]BET57303.1 OmpA family protein [Geobacter sp. 60473]